MQIIGFDKSALTLECAAITKVVCVFCGGFVYLLFRKRTKPPMLIHTCIETLVGFYIKDRYPLPKQ